MWSEMMGREVKLCSQLASHINQPRAIEQWVFFELLGLWQAKVVSLPRSDSGSSSHLYH